MASVEYIEPSSNESSGYFYKRLGEICFSNEPDTRLVDKRREHRPSQRLALASRHGIAILAEHTGKRSQHCISRLFIISSFPYWTDVLALYSEHTSLRNTVEQYVSRTQVCKPYMQVSTSPT
jgi:hypothetical protein